MDNISKFSFQPFPGNQDPTTIALTGDVTGSGTTSIATTLATVNSNVGTFQGLTVNGKGLVTAASDQHYITGNQTITFSGDVSGSGTTTVTLTIGSGKVTNANLVNSAVTINGTSVALGASGTVTAAANTLTGTILASGVVTSSLTSVGTIGTGVWQGTAISNTYLSNSSVTINGTSISLGASGTVTAAAGTLTGATLASGVTGSSLTSFGASIALGTPASGTLTNCTGPWPTDPLTTKGDIWCWSTTNDKLAVGSAYQVPFANSTASTGLAYDYARHNQEYTKSVTFFTDMVGAAAGASSGSYESAFTSANANSGLTADNSTLVTDGSRVGIWQCSTSTSTNARAALTFFCNGVGSQSKYLGSGQTICDFGIKIDQLSNGTDTFTIQIGLLTINSATPSGVFLSYTHGTNSGNWVMTSKLSGTQTANSSTAADTNWHTYRIVLNAGLTTASFYIDGVQLGNSPLSITGAASAINPSVQLIKSLGATACTMQTDYCFLSKDFTNSR